MTDDTTEGTRADGKPWVHPLTRAAWRTWLIANYETSSGVHLVTWRKATGKPAVGYGRGAYRRPRPWRRAT